MDVQPLRKWGSQDMRRRIQVIQADELHQPDLRILSLKIGNSSYFLPEDSIFYHILWLFSIFRSQLSICSPFFSRPPMAPLRILDVAGIISPFWAQKIRRNVPFAKPLWNCWGGRFRRFKKWVWKWVVAPCQKNGWWIIIVRNWHGGIRHFQTHFADLFEAFAAAWARWSVLRSTGVWMLDICFRNVNGIHWKATHQSSSIFQIHYSSRFSQREPGKIQADGFWLLSSQFGMHAARAATRWTQIEALGKSVKHWITPHRVVSRYLLYFLVKTNMSMGNVPFLAHHYLQEKLQRVPSFFFICSHCFRHRTPIPGTSITHGTCFVWVTGRS